MHVVRYRGPGAPLLLVGAALASLAAVERILKTAPSGGDVRSWRY